LHGVAVSGTFVLQFLLETSAFSDEFQMLVSHGNVALLCCSHQLCMTTGTS
jgi:hypothetical protein